MDMRKVWPWFFAALLVVVLLNVRFVVEIPSEDPASQRYTGKDLNEVPLAQVVVEKTAWTYEVELEAETGPVTNVKMKGVKNVSEVSNLRIVEVKEETPSNNFDKVYSIDPTKVEFKDATVTAAAAKGKELFKCIEWNFTTQECYGDWEKVMDLTPGEPYVFNLTPADPGFVEITPYCRAENNDQKERWKSLCDGIYPSACENNRNLLMCDDNFAETQGYQNLGIPRYAGLLISHYDYSGEECPGIESVELCYEMWHNGDKPDDCEISVDDGSGSWKLVSDACPGSKANPGVQCVNITSLGNWKCSSFSGENAAAKAKVQVAPGNHKDEGALITDVFYFNVGYKSPQAPDDIPPSINSIEEIEDPVEEGDDITIYADITDNIGVKAAFFEIDSTRYAMSKDEGNAWKYTFSPNRGIGSYSYKIFARDNRGNSAEKAESFSVHDSTPPGPISRLEKVSVGVEWVYWMWNNPSDEDFSYVEIWADGKLHGRALSPDNIYNATNITSENEVLFKFRAVDSSGNKGAEWVEASAKPLKKPGSDIMMEWIDPDEEKEGNDIIEVEEAGAESSESEAGFVKSLWGNILNIFS